MKALFLVLLCIAGLGLPAWADWRDELSSPDPGGFPPLRPFHAAYKFGWSALTAAEASFGYRKAKGGAMRMDVKARSTGAVRALWKMDLQYVALMQAATLLPISVRQSETYSDKSIDLKLDFTPEGVTRLREITPPDPKPPKAKHFSFPNLEDLNSALHWVRSQPLENGDHYKFVVLPGRHTPISPRSMWLGRKKNFRRPAELECHRAGPAALANRLESDLQPRAAPQVQARLDLDFRRCKPCAVEDRRGNLHRQRVWAELDSLDFD